PRRDQGDPDQSQQRAVHDRAGHAHRADGDRARHPGQPARGGRTLGYRTRRGRFRLHRREAKSRGGSLGIMFELSKRLTAAMEAVLYIAYNSGTRPISSRQLAEYQGVKTRYLEQILQKLVHGGLLRGVRGPYGGYLLAKDKRHITLGEICS